ncbi:MAG: hypothetical protein LBM70_02820 [Victivallales bacterium]|jgi:hypothetical protein|nr:hypothetical protein [Victivallales bacterium]
MSNTYRWQFSSEAVHSELGDTPETLLNDGVEIKANPVRRVIRNGEYFLKCDRRGVARLLREWKSAKLLRASEIPVVEYLACGNSPNGGCLITRALPNSESVADFYYTNFVRNHENPKAFLDSFAAFMRIIFNSGLFHPDFHIGNILYDKHNHKFVLVDAMGIRKSTLFDRLFYNYRMWRIVMELREILDREQMIRLIASCKIPNPKLFYDRALDREADMLWKEWPKRRNQILTGYPKFTRQIDGVLHVVDPLRQIAETIDCEVIENEDTDTLEKMFLAHYFLQLAKIPHRRAKAYDPEGGKLYLEIVPARAIPVRASDQRERMTAFDLPSEPIDWLKDNDGNVRFFNLKRIANLM